MAAMTESLIAALNERFGRDSAVQFREGRGGLPLLRLGHGEASADIYLQGAQVTRYRPGADSDALWMSKSATYRPGKALRGGIPLCWPWFGPAGDNLEHPQHGYARNAEFCVLSTSANATATSVTLALDPAQAPSAEWQNRLQLEVEIRLSDSLWMEMRSSNLDSAPLTLSNALHSYFAISDRANIAIPALTGLTYLDKLLDYRSARQSHAIEFVDEIDRVYLDPPATVELRDAGRNGSTIIQCWGNANLVVWNPGEQKAKAMADFDDEGFRRMVCIEPANALAQSVVLQPGECQSLGQRITLLVSV